MESNKKAKNIRKLQTHQFISKINKQHKELPKLRVIRGYVGECTRKDHLRIYLDIELRRFVEIPEKAVVHFEDFRQSRDSVTPVYLWVGANAKIRHYGNWIANDDPTTMATGEEGGGNPTTMATGEESDILSNPYDQLINPSPFGQFS